MIRYNTEAKEKNAKIGRILAFFCIGLFLLLTIWIVFFPDRKDYEHMVRSSSLQQVTKQTGNVTEITFVNADGTPTFADNVRYATIRRTKEGNCVREEYLDEKGEKVKQNAGHYALLREYDKWEREVRVTWLDAEGKPCVNSSGYASLVRTFDAENRAVTELYHDADGAPVETSYYGYGRSYAYDELGRQSLVTYLDHDGNAVVTGQGFAAIRRSYYTKEGMTDRVEKEFFLDAGYAPQALANGTYARRLTYDELGRRASLTCLDQQGEPMMTTEGFSAIRYTYYEDDSVRTEMYFDTAGAPVALGQGQYGVLHEGDRVTYLAEDGSEHFSLRNLLYNQPILPVLAALAFVVVSLLTGRRVNIILLVLFLGVIAYMTLLERSQSAGRTVLGLFRSYRYFFSDYTTRKEIIDNIWLFIPLGAIIYRIFPKRWIWILPLMLSIGIEGLQFLTGRGTAEVDDIISNGLGGAIGVLVAISSTWFRAFSSFSRSRSDTD